MDEVEWEGIEGRGKVNWPRHGRSGICCPMNELCMSHAGCIERHYLSMVSKFHVLAIVLRAARDWEGYPRHWNFFRMSPMLCARTFVSRWASFTLAGRARKPFFLMITCIKILC